MVWKSLQLGIAKLFMDEHNIAQTTKKDQVFFLRNCTGYEAVRLVIDCIMSNKFWKLINFHFPTRLNVLWLCKYF
jgi:hypothetical protein